MDSHSKPAKLPPLKRDGIRKTGGGHLWGSIDPALHQLSKSSSRGRRQVRLGPPKRLSARNLPSVHPHSHPPTCHNADTRMGKKRQVLPHISSDTSTEPTKAGREDSGALQQDSFRPQEGVQSRTRDIVGTVQCNGDDTENTVGAVTDSAPQTTAPRHEEPSHPDPDETAPLDGGVSCSMAEGGTSHQRATAMSRQSGVESTASKRSEGPYNPAMFPRQDASPFILPAKKQQDPQSLTETEQRILSGSLEDLPPPPQGNIVRIFLSSTFSDMKEERGHLFGKAFPRLQQYCQSRGLDFQVVDMRWGVTDTIINDHMTSHVCLEQIDICRRISMGPHFVVLLGNRYGFQALPRTIATEEFEVLQTVWREHKLAQGNMVEEWYSLDTNAVPPVYTLHPINSKLPEYASPQVPSQARQAASDTWQRVEAELRSTLQQVVSTASTDGRISQEQAEKYFFSVTEEEVAAGMTSLSQSQPLCSYKRHLIGLRDNITDSLASKFIDLRVENDKKLIDKEKQERLEVLCTQCKASTDSGHIIHHEYEAHWQDTGVDPSNSEHNRVYLQNMGDAFESDIKNAIESAFSSEKGKSSDDQTQAIFEEVLHHARFANDRCSRFYGRKQDLQGVQKHLLDDTRCSLPLVVYGESGCGKSSLMAKIASMAQEVLGPGCVLITRFLGTSPDSSDTHSVLVSVCLQICTAYNMEKPSDEDFSSMVNILRTLHAILEKVSLFYAAERPLLMLMDSIDQLSSRDGHNRYQWIFKDELPDNVYMVVSVVDEENGLVESVKKHLSAHGSFLQLSSLTQTDVVEMMDSTLDRHQRSLTSEQRRMVEEAAQVCPFPLYLTLLLNQAVVWTSFHVVPPHTLPSTTVSAIESLFTSLQHKYGSVFVRHCLGYLTIAQGLSEVELEDVLSCTDEVLDEVYHFHDPPVAGITRVPPLLWARLRHDLQDLLVERAEDGVTVLNWHHNMFAKVIEAQLMKPGSEGRTMEQDLNRQLADLFMAGGDVKRTVELTKRHLIIHDADRQVAPRPLIPSNKRKLIKLPQFILSSGSFDDIKNTLKEQVLCNVEWVITKLRGTSFNGVLGDYEMVEDKDEEITLMKRILYLASPSIQQDPDYLPVELISRLPKHLSSYPHISAMMAAAHSLLHETNVTRILPKVPCLPCPNGVLSATIQGPTHILGLHQEKEAIIWSQDLGVQVWSLESHEAVHHVCDALDVFDVALDEEHRTLLTIEDTHLLVFDIASGELLHKTDLLPDVSSTGRTCILATESPFLKVMAISKDSTFIAVRINKVEMLLDGKGLIIVKLCKTGAQVQNTLMKDLFGERLTNVTFLETEKVGVAVTYTKGLKGSSSTLYLYDDVHQDEVRTLTFPPQLSLPPLGVKLSGDSTKLAVMCRPDTLAVVQVPALSFLYQEEFEKSTTSRRMVDLYWTSDTEVFMVSFDIKAKNAILRLQEDTGNIKWTQRSVRGQPDNTSINIAQDLGYISYRYSGGSIEIWKISTGELVHAFIAHAADVNSILHVDCSPYLHTASADRTLKLWLLSGLLPQEVTQTSSDAASVSGNPFKELCQIRPEYAIHVAGMTFVDHPDTGDQELLTWYDSRPPALWSLQSGDMVETLHLSQNVVAVVKILQSPDKQIIALAKVQEPHNEHCHIMVWSGGENKCWQAVAKQVQVDAMALSPDGTRLLAVKKQHAGSTVYVLEVGTWDKLYENTSPLVLLSDYIIMSPDHFYCAGVNERGNIPIWNLAETKAHPLMSSNESEAEDDGAESSKKRSLALPVSAMVGCAVMVEPATLIVGSSYGSLLHFDLHNMKALDDSPLRSWRLVQEKHAMAIKALAMSQDKQYLVSASTDCMKVVNLVARTVVHNIQLEDATNINILSVCISSDNSFIATGSRDKTIRMWDFQTGNQLARFNAHDEVYHMILSRDMKSLAALSQREGDRNLLLCEVLGVGE